ncbi:MAG: SDR family oxidoreductase [Acidobacteriota bacterium]|nr:SDR family oxidoreductase [Acidobacteriota bacterium]
MQEITRQYDFSGRVIVVTGGAGVLGREMVRALLGCGGSVAVIDRKIDHKQAQEEEFRSESDTAQTAQIAQTAKGELLLLEGDVLDKGSIDRAARQVIDKWGKIDGLVNAAGGNHPDATTGAAQPFFDLPQEALRFVSDLNLLGTVIPSQVFGKIMAGQKTGVILNVSSMNAFRPLTRIPAYSAAKAAVSNFTQWLAVHLAQEYSPSIRVNAIAPGFFLTDQNRFLLTEKETGALTARGGQILAHTPMGRFGAPEDLIGGVLWLLSPLSGFVTGVVLPIDGGFSAYSGV